MSTSGNHHIFTPYQVLKKNAKPNKHRGGGGSRVAAAAEMITIIMRTIKIAISSDCLWKSDLPASPSGTAPRYVAALRPLPEATA